MTNDAILILQGTTYAQSAFNFNGSSWVQFNGAGQIQPGNALSKTGNTLNVKYDNSTISINGSNQLYVPNGALTTTQLSSAANIAFSQLAALTSANILVGNGSNVAASVSVSGDLTLANTGAFTVAKIQGTVVSGTTGTTNVVFSGSPTITGTMVVAAANFSGAIGANGGITSTGALSINANSGASAINLLSSSVLRGASTGAAINETYVDSTTLVDNSGPTAVTAFQFSTATYSCEEISYAIKTGTSTADVRQGVLRVTCNASGTQVTSITDDFTESADCGVQWSASVTTGTVSVSYTTTNQGSNRTMRADQKLFRA
jgi:mucin-19